MDEYQDTNTAQYRLIRHLTERRKNLCVVGDDDQSIYRWRGADLGNILEFERDFPETTVVVLGKNYRSSKNILGAAGSVVRNNIGRKEKRLWTDNEQGEKLVFFEAGDEHEEARYVIRIDKGPHGPPRIPAGGFCRILPDERPIAHLEDELIRQSVGYQIIGGMRFYDRMEIKDAMAYLRSAVMPNDSVSLDSNHQYASPRHRRQNHRERSGTLASKRDIDFHRAAGLLVEEGSAAPKAARGIASIMDILGAIGSEEGIVGAARKAVIDSGMLAYWQSMRTEEAQARVENLEEFMSAVAEYRAGKPERRRNRFPGSGGARLRRGRNG